MLAGCPSSTLLSPTTRLRSEAPAAIQFAHHFPMNTQRLELPYNSFSRKEHSSNRSSQSIKPLARSISTKSKTSGCSLKQNINLPPLTTTRGEETFSWSDSNNRGRKRLAEEEDESCLNRVKRKRDETESFADQKNSPSLPFSLACSGDEDKAGSVPLTSNPDWIDSLITELAGGIDDKDTDTLPFAEVSVSTSASSETHRLHYRLPESTNGLRNGAGTSEEVTHRDDDDLQKDFELVGLLTGCLEAIRSRNTMAVHHCISRLGDLASPRGRSSMSRLTAYYTEALALRCARTWPHIFHVTPPPEFDEEPETALRLLNQVTPIPKFIHFTANEMLLRAFEGKERVHIIDFDIKQGLQWPSFFQSLASRPNPPQHVRVTGIGESKHELNETGDRLHGFAEALDLPFEFHPVVDRLEDVRLWMLHVKEGESVAINCVFQMHKTLYDETGAAIRDFVGLIKSTNPIALALAEQEAETNSDHLETRVCNSLKYYSAMFDAMHLTLPTESLIRVRIEEMLFGREIRNIVACEGIHRQERHIGFGQWSRMLEQLGFRSLGVTEREVLQSKMLLRMYGGGNYDVKRREKEAGGGVTLRWSEQPLYTVSAWTHADIGGVSSSFSQRS